MSSRRCVCPQCEATYSGSQHSGGHCMVCHKTFRTDRAGSKHRVGPHHPPGLRRCLTQGEMLDQGWRLTDRGWTNEKPMTEEQKALRGFPATTTTAISPLGVPMYQTHPQNPVVPPARPVESVPQRFPNPWRNPFTRRKR